VAALALAGVHNFGRDQEEVQHAEAGESTARSGCVENPGDAQRELGDQYTPQVGPRQDDHEQADLDEVPDVDGGGEQAGEPHPAILSDRGWSRQRKGKWEADAQPPARCVSVSVPVSVPDIPSDLGRDPSDTGTDTEAGKGWDVLGLTRGAVTA
jgi:hypothetical protein